MFQRHGCNKTSLRHCYPCTASIIVQDHPYNRWSCTKPIRLFVGGASRRAEMVCQPHNFFMLSLKRQSQPVEKAPPLEIPSFQERFVRSRAEGCGCRLSQIVCHNLFQHLDLFGITIKMIHMIPVYDILFCRLKCNILDMTVQ